MKKIAVLMNYTYKTVFGFGELHERFKLRNTENSKSICDNDSSCGI